MNPTVLADQLKRLRPSPPPVVRHPSFFVPDLSPDPKPCFVLDNLAVGSQDCAFSPHTPERFTHIVNVGHGIPNAFPDRLVYFQCDMYDNGDFDLYAHFQEIHQFIDQALQSSSRNAVLIHCQAGVSRSVAVVMSYLMLVQARSGRVPKLKLALEQVVRVRPSAKPNAGFIKTLQAWELELTMRYPVVERKNPCKEAIPFSVPFSIQIQRWRQLASLALLLLRPALTGVSLFIVVCRFLWSQKVSYPALVFFLYQWKHLQRDEGFQAFFYQKLQLARPGVYAKGELKSQFQSMLDIVEYKAPFWLGGDVSTCFFALSGYRGSQAFFFRREVVECQNRRFSLDWAFPQQTPSLANEVCLLLAGIGGDSHSAYVRDVTRQLLDEGRVVAVLLSNDGNLNNTLATTTVSTLFNPADDGDIFAALDVLSIRYPQIHVVGFSLGAVALCRIFSAYPSERLPRNVMGGVSISGSFQVDFIHQHEKYAQTYQPVLVSGLVDRFVHCFGEAQLGGRSFLSCQTYEHLHQHLYAESTTDFMTWTQQLASSPSQVKRPLLFLTDLADPLHHCDMLGLNRLWDHTEDKNSNDIHENVIVVVTNGGGHVSWPVSNESGYAYLARVVNAFCTLVNKTTTTT